MKNYKLTKNCCYIGLIVQALAINFLPLLFVAFKNDYNLSYALIGTLVSVNFVTQICVDVFSVFFIDKIGYKPAVLTAHFCCAAGFVLLAILPEIINPFMGLCISVITFSIGAGLVEVVVNPIMAMLPKEVGNNLVLLHSFYCWGQVGVVLLTTIALYLFGTDTWNIIAVLWAILPLINGLLFIKAPVTALCRNERREKASSLFANKTFFAILILMVCAGGSELAMAQWASAFTQNALGIDKTTGDLLGPCLFAFFMGIGRLIYGLYEKRMDFRLCSTFSCVLCVGCYVTAALSKNPYAALLGCALCGFSVSTFWPGVVELAHKKFPAGGGAMFSAVAIFGDIGCSVAPFITGVIASMSIFGENAFRMGMLFNIIYPIGFFVIICTLMRKRK